VAKFDKVISPGQEGKITLEVDGNKVHGTFSKSASVLSNDPKHPRITLQLTGSVVRYIDIVPTDRVYLSAMYGEPAEREVTIVSNEKGLDFKILRLESNIDDKITYKLYPGDAENKYKLKVWKNPKLPAMNTWGSITVYTNSKKSPTKVIQVNVATRSLIKAQPSIINFGRIPLSEDTGVNRLEKTITVSKVKGEFSIKNISFTNDYYTASYQALEEGKRYTITVKFNPDQVRRRYSDQMIISTDDPHEPVVKIRLLARTI
jgi:hypothetical protein